MSIWIRAGLFALILTACAEDGRELVRLPGGSECYLIAFGDQSEALDSAAVANFDMVMYDTDGIPLTRSNEEIRPTPGDDLWTALAQRHVGDSLLFVSVGQDQLRQDGFRTDSLVYLIRITGMRTQSQLEDGRMREFAALDALIHKDSVSTQFREHDGIWLRTLTPGDTALVWPGREIVIQYQGRTLHGKVFDDSRAQEGALRFVMGHEHQVLPGIERALYAMHRGETAEAIIPSWLAFGSKGSVAGVVGPFTPVIYRIEVKELARN